MADFSLKKWYFDVADAKGNVYIGYRASLKWGGLVIEGWQHLYRPPAGPVKTKICLGNGALPVSVKPGHLAWNPDETAGSWDLAAVPIEETLLDSKNGKIVWRCLQPKSQARIESKEISFAGWGYVERIDITVPVWELPFKTLYWGRCHTKNHWLVWIKWEGVSGKTVYWFDGARGKNLMIGEDGIAGKDFKLDFGKKIPLRQGMIASTVFKSVAALLEKLPQPALCAHENKWYGSGKLAVGGKNEDATIIYEKVIW